MSKELARLPFVNKECMQAISSYEAQYGEIVMNGKRYIDELKEALADSKKQTVSTLIDIKVLPKTMTDGYGAWWHVGLASVSESEAVRRSYEAKEENRKNARKY